MASTSDRPTGVCERRGTKWYVEKYDEPAGPIKVRIGAPKQVVVVTQCNNCVVEVEGKCAEVVLDGCTKCGVIFDSVIAQCAVSRCNKVQVQVKEKASTFMIENTHGCTVFLNAASLDAEIYTSCCTEVNIMEPPVDEDGELTGGKRIRKGDMPEHPVPSHYKSVLVEGKLVTNAVKGVGSS